MLKQLTRDHTVSFATHPFIHKWNELYLPLFPIRRASPHFGWYSLQGKRRSWPGWLGEILKWFARRKTVAHPSIKFDTHYPCPRTVFTDRAYCPWTLLSKMTPVFSETCAVATANFSANFDVYSDISDAETLEYSIAINAVLCLVRYNVGSRPSDHYFRSVCWFVSLSVCLCRVFLSRLWSDFDQTRTYVMCLGLVASRRI